MVYEYNRFKYMILFNLIFLIIPMTFATLISYLVEGYIKWSDLHVVLLFIWIIIFFLSILDSTQKIIIKKNTLIRKSPFSTITIQWSDVKEVRYSVLFKQLIIYSSNSTILLNCVYKDYNVLYKNIICKLRTHRVSIPQVIEKLVE